MLNKVQLIGRLGADPETKHLQSGAVVCNMRVATSEKWRDKSSGERKERTDWHSVVIWNENLAGIAEQYLRKGSQVYLEGKLQTREWEKNGEKRYSTEVVLTGFDCKLVMLDGRNGGDAGEGRGGGGQSSGGAPRRSAPSQRYDMDDEIPF